MSEEHARGYISQVIKILREQELEPRDKALILASLAQAEATLELVSQVKNGLDLELRGNAVSVLDGFNHTAPALADAIARLPGRLGGT